LLQRWLEILDQPLGEILAFLVDRSEEADLLRKAHPSQGS
jgi:hypothetical protein